MMLTLLIAAAIFYWVVCIFLAANLTSFLLHHL